MDGFMPRPGDNHFTGFCYSLDRAVKEATCKQVAHGRDAVGRLARHVAGNVGVDGTLVQHVLDAFPGVRRSVAQRKLDMTPRLSQRFEACRPTSAAQGLVRGRPPKLMGISVP